MKECPTGTTVYTYYFDYETHELICESPHTEGRGIPGRLGKKLRVDFYLPTHNLVIEYDGIHHYEKNKFQ